MSDRFPDFLNPVIKDGNVVSGAKLEFFITGTSTPKDTYTTSAKTVANANPVIADSAGRFPEIFMDTSTAYKVTLSDADDVVIWTKDPISPVLAPGTFPRLSVSSTAGNFSIVATDHATVFLVDASAGPVTATLPPVIDAMEGFRVTLIKAEGSVNVVTIDGDGTETINGVTTVGLGEQYDAITLVGDGTAWTIESEKRLPTPQVGIADQNVVVNATGTGFTTAAAGLPTGHLTGLILSNNATDATNDIDIAAGRCRSDADDADIILTAAVGKQFDVSWSAGGTPGAPTGGLSSSLTLTNDTWYHAIAGLVSGTAEVGFDTSITGANLVTDHSFTNTRRIGSVRRGTATNLAFLQDGNEFYWDVAIQDVNAANPGTAAVLRTLTVPTGVRVKAMIGVLVDDASTGSGAVVLLTPTDIADTTPSSSAFHMPNTIGSALSWQQGGYVEILADTSAQIRSRIAASAADIDLIIVTHGYIDRRGR